MGDSTCLFYIFLYAAVFQIPKHILLRNCRYYQFHAHTGIFPLGAELRVLFLFLLCFVLKLFRISICLRSSEILLKVLIGTQRYMSEVQKSPMFLSMRHIADPCS